MRLILFSFFILILINSACKSPANAHKNIMPGIVVDEKNPSQPVLQGVTGTVAQLVGNQMPKVGRTPPQPKAFPTTVFFYEPTNIAQVTALNQSALYSSINTQLITSVKTDSTGAFTQSLPVGTYSVFVKVGNYYFANLLDTQNNIALVRVEKDKLTVQKIIVNNAAAY